jgi:acetylornithine deacetylase
LPNDLAKLLSQLVAIDSVNPSLVPGGAGEREIAAFVAAWAREAGLEVEVLEATPGRPSVIARARGTGGGRSLLLCGHCDTVTTEGMRDPRPRVDGDPLYGRGAYDMKAGVAAALVACREAAALGLAGDVIVAAVADEEHASLGVQEVLAAVTAGAAIVTEPTELELVVAHRGFVWSEIEVSGRAAHGSRPHLGVDAIVKTGPILTALGELDVALGERTQPTARARTVRGGPGGGDRRRPARRRDRCARRAPGDRRAGYWADAAFIAAAGIPTAMFGPAGEGAHAAEEWVSIASTEAVARTLVAVAARVCA